MAAAGAVLTGLLFLGYLRVSWTVAATSDGAAQALQARDMLAGNWLLHGWTVSDVSFYTTELPEYVLVELVRPFGVGVIHVAAAVTYTLLVLGAFALARGRARGPEGLARGVVAAGIMLAPQLGYGAFVLLLSPDHVGTQVPLLLGWLLLDRAPRRWWVPAVLGLLLAVVQFADRVALLTAVLPLVLVCTVALVRTVAARKRPPWSACWYEVALAGAAVGSVGVAWAEARVLDAAGGFTAHPLPFTLAPFGLLWTHTWLTGWGVLEVYGANFLGVSGWAGVGFSVIHLAGLALAIAAVAVALGRFLRPEPNARSGSLLPAQKRIRLAGDGGAGGGGAGGARAGLVDSVLGVAVVANLVSYVVSIEPGTVVGTGYDAREIAAVLPLGAVLAGRVFGPRISAMFAKAASRTRSGGWILVGLAFGLVVGGYGGAFGYSATRPGAAGRDAVLADWLVGHGLRYGLGGAAANVVTTESGGRAVVRAVTVHRGRVRSLLYQSEAEAYDPGRHAATFLVTRAPAGGAGYAAEVVPAAAVRATFGRPARVYRFDGFTVDVWGVNLLTKMRELAAGGGQCSQSHMLEGCSDAAC